MRFADVTLAEKGETVDPTLGSITSSLLSSKILRKYASSSKSASRTLELVDASGLSVAARVGGEEWTLELVDAGLPMLVAAGTISVVTAEGLSVEVTAGEDNGELHLRCSHQSWLMVCQSHHPMCLPELGAGPPHDLRQTTQ